MKFQIKIKRKTNWTNSIKLNFCSFLKLIIVLFSSIEISGCSLQNSTAITGRTGRIDSERSEKQKTLDQSQDGSTAKNPDGSPSGDNASSTTDQEGLPWDPNHPNPMDPFDQGQTGPGQGVPGQTNPKNQNLNESLIWKRYRALEGSLMESLSLTKQQVCVELGQYSCIDAVHLTILGGNEPFINGQHERAERPTVLTPVSSERVVLAACQQRVNLDKTQSSSKVVFKHIDFNAMGVSPDQAKAQITELYRLFYARDPSESELTTALETLKIVSVPEKVALGLCFSIGSSIENFFI